MKTSSTLKKTVILDTDLGSDIDDSWALAMLLNSPEFDLKLVLTASGDTIYRAKIAAKMLEAAERGDIPIGIGIPTQGPVSSMTEWTEDYDLNSYPGDVYEDGIQKCIDIIKNSDKAVTIIAIGPMTNIAEMLRRDPSVALKSNLVCMLGSVRKGYDGSSEVHCEYNVATDPEACAASFAAPWDVTITPLDTCGIVSLDGDNYKRILDSDSTLLKAVLESYRVWSKFCGHDKSDEAVRRGSSILYDTAAVYLAFDDSLIKMEKIGLKVTPKGYTLIDDSMKKINCAMEWKDLSEFEKLVTDRLCR